MTKWAGLPPTWVTSTPLMLVQPRENRDVKAAKNRHEVCLGWVQAAATFGGCNPIHEITMTSFRISHFIAVALLAGLTSCNLITVGGAGKNLGQPANTASPSGTNGDGGTSATVKGVIVEGQLRKQYCAEVANRAAPFMSRLAASQKMNNPLAQLDQHAKILQEVAAMTVTLQSEYDAAYKTQSRAADQANIAGDVGIGYGNGDNSTRLQGSEALVEVLVSATKIMSDNGLPFSTSGHGLAAGAVVMVAQSGCESPRATALAKQLEANVRSLAAPFNVSDALLAEPLVVANGKMIDVRGEVTSLKPLTLRTSTEQNHYNNCTTTNRFDHFDANGNARYLEKCKYTGSNKGVVTVTASGGETVLPAGVKVEVGDEVRMIARVLTNETKAVSRGKMFLRTTQLAITPLVFTEIARNNTRLYTY